MKKFRNKSYIDLISFSVELKVTDVTEITIKDNEFIMHNIEEIILSEDKTILIVKNTVFNLYETKSKNSEYLVLQRRHRSDGGSQITNQITTANPHQ